jgi:hypothetical protein
MPTARSPDGSSRARRAGPALAGHMADTPMTDERSNSMPPRGVKSPKRKRQYEKIKKSELSRGRSPKVAKRIAAATTNKTRRKKGETKSSRKKS